MADIQIGKAPKNIAVLPFYGTGAFFFLLFSILLLASAADLEAGYFNRHLLALVHTAALGWGTMVIFGASYQLLPVICEKDLFSERLAFLSWCLLTPGVCLLVASFWLFRPGWMMLSGGGSIFCAAVLYGVNLVFTARHCSRYSMQKSFILSSAGWLLVTISIGLVLAVNLYHPFLSRNHLDILKLHAHAGLAGWFLQLVIGVSSKLIPMFLLGKSGRGKWLRPALYLQNSGLILFLTDGYLAGPTPRFFLYEGLVLAGTLLWMGFLYDCFRQRVRKKTDMPMKHVAISMICLLAGFILAPLAYYGSSSWWSVLYGLLLFAGWITALILGKTFKTLPFIVWNGHYKNSHGKGKTPLPKHLYSEQAVACQFRIYIASLAFILAGILFRVPVITRAGLWLWLGVALLYAGNVMRVLLHKTVSSHGNQH